MKKKVKILALFLTVLFSLSLLTSCNNKQNTQLQTINLNEVVRSVFYAPMYVALNKGFFEDEGMTIELSTGQGADKTMQQVLSGACDIGFCGPEQVIYIHNQGRSDYPVLFAQLTKTDGSFLVGRTDEKDFEWESLKGKTIIGGRPGGVPEMTLEYVLRNHGITPHEDVEIITNLAFTATAGAFKAGTGDYVTLFEPTASMLEFEGTGYIVDSIGEKAGSIPYTCYFSTKSYMDSNPGVIQRFTDAIYRGQIWVDTHTDEEVAKEIQPFFPGSDLTVLTNVVKNYRSIDAYASDPIMNEDDLTRLMDIIQSYDQGLIPSRPPFDDMVNTTFAEKTTSK
ncbi:ABC transporter substrate-binding protein [Clostridium sediminicola]|uniref:ABC transporter substrate-binding protein n=1 Tax=Clostridium sediminicola TaxID=3114879 RepID=UPI0031F27B1B